MSNHFMRVIATQTCSSPITLHYTYIVTLAICSAEISKLWHIFNTVLSSIVSIKLNLED